MDDRKALGDRYLVGSFVVDLNAATIQTESGKVYTLQEKALKTFCILLQSQGKYFTNDRLIDLVYGNVSVSTSTIAKNIQLIRDAFEDKNKLIIENRSKVGYRLTLEVKPLADKNRTTKPAKNSGSHKESFLKQRKIEILGLSIVVLTLIASTYFLKQNHEVRDLLTQTPITHSKGQEYFPTLSENGEWLVYSHRKNTNDWSLQIRNLKTDINKTLSQAKGVSFKHGQLTRDLHRILFTSIQHDKCELMEGAFNIPSTSLTNVRTLSQCSASAKGARIIEGQNDDQYIITDNSAIDSPYGLYLISSITGRREALTAPPTTGRGDYFMDLSPDRRRLVFLRNVERYVTEIRLLDLKKRDDTYLTRVNTTLFSIRWSNDGKHLIFKNTENQVVAMDWASGEQKILKQARFSIYAPFPLDDSNQRIGVIAGSLIDKDINSMSLESKAQKPILESSFSENLPVYSPKANRLAWVSNKTGLFQVWIKEGTEQEQRLTDLKRNGRFTSLDFSNDGEKLGGTFEGKWFVYDLTSNSLKWSESRDRHYSNFSWQPDNISAYVLETYNRESIMKTLDVEEGKIYRYSKYPDANLVKQSPNGKWLYAWFKQSHRFIRLNQDTGELTEIDIKNQSALSNQWAIADDWIVWVNQPANDEPHLYQLYVSNSSPFQLGKDSYYGSISIAPQNKNIILTTRAKKEIELIEI